MDETASRIQTLAGKRIRTIRELAGKTQEEVCEALGIDQSTYSKWEAGKRLPNLFAMISFARRFRVSLDFIFLGRQAGVHPGLADVLQLSHPDLLSGAPSDTDSGKDKALESYRAAIVLQDGG